jgi:hypothetical protein
MFETLLCLHQLTMHASSASAAAAAAAYSALQQQLAFSTALLLDWCGVAPAGSAEQVLQQLVQ